MDDTPRAEFTPRQRHTLKEFAAIVMREMELWRDKIQLRIRERIQTSMEQFTRECLEIDGEDGADAKRSQYRRSPTPPGQPSTSGTTPEGSPKDAAARDDVEAEKRNSSPGKARVVSAAPSRSSTPALDREQNPENQSQHHAMEQQQRLRSLSAMDRVYERAARLVKRTLDVEGAVVMDVSTFDVLETTKAEGALSIVCHHAQCAPTHHSSTSVSNPTSSVISTNTNVSNPSGTAGGGNAETGGVNTVLSPLPPGSALPSEHVVHTGPMTHTVSPEERPLFMEFFARHPEGKIAEGIVPRAFRALLPTRVQHALSAYI